MNKQLFFVKSDFGFIKTLGLPEEQKLRIISEMVRNNVLGMVMLSASGHIGASFSGADVLTILYHKIMKINPADHLDPKRDIFLLSKGHASPLSGAMLASVGLVPDEALFHFRRLNGLQGHVDLRDRGVEGNSGSLAMGISKGKGHALAFKKQNLPNKVFVMVGDGELQEGQNWEGLQTAKAWGLGNLVVLLDKNKIQSDMPVDHISPMPPVEEKLRAFGWQVIEVDGHDMPAMINVFEGLNYNDGQPKALVLDTIKGKGVSFMEHPVALAKDGIYYWHNKIPSVEEFQSAIAELHEKIKNLLNGQNIPGDFYPGLLETFERQQIAWTQKGVVDGFSDGLIELIKENSKVIALDGDLSVDCGVKVIEKDYPNNFLEVGIAEQDMVSIAGGLARQGYLPIVNTFSAFLSARANEQIFNNSSEHTKVIYAGHLAGFIPATPGKSHQAIRDIGLMRTIPEMAVVEPCSYEEAKLMIKYLARERQASSYMRLANCKSLAEIALPENYKIEQGIGFVAKEGKDAAIIAYGPILLPQALQAAELLAKDNISARVINLPWLNNLDADWLTSVLSGIDKVFVIDNHMLAGGLGEEVLGLANEHPELKAKAVVRFGLETFMESGWVEETLKRFKLDSLSIAERIQARLK